MSQTGLTETADIWLPGALQAQGFGDLPAVDSPWVGNVREREWSRPEYAPYREPDNFKMPFWLQPDRVFMGSAWYSREIMIPRAWETKHITLHLERAHWVTEAWINGEKLGKRESLSTPHEYHLGLMEPGTYTLDLRVDNRMAYGVGPNAHSMTDHTQTNWNGVVGAIELRAMPAISVRSVRVEPSAADRSAKARATIVNRSDKMARVPVTFHATNDHAPSASMTRTVTIPAEKTQRVEVTLDLGDDAAMWTEFSPHPYALEVTANSDHGSHTHATTFGLRDLTSEDGRFLINGTPIYLRGTLECAIFPRTGYPPTDVAEWERIFNRVKEFGLNHVRYHSWCPPKAAFVAADKVGVYLQVEGPFWVNQGPKLGLGQTIDEYVYDETQRILEEFGNHPSFLLMAYGNEPSGPGPTNNGGIYLAKWLNHFKVRDTRRLFTSGSGWPLIDESQYHVTYEPRIQRWGEGLNSTINSKPPTTRGDYNEFASNFEAPVVSHEIGQWCVYPNFEEMGKYTGHLKPKNFEIFRDLMANNNLAHRELDFLMASGKLQVLAYKADIEAALRTEDFGGFQLLDLHDFPGQGTALVGVLDPFWDPKPYVNAEEFRAFCSPVVPLASFDGRAFEDGDTLTADIEIAQFAGWPIERARVRWSIETEDGQTMASGDFPRMTLDAGKLAAVGTINTKLAASEPVHAKLTVGIAGTVYENSWDLWVYPKAAPAELPDGVYLATSIDETVESTLALGGTVILMPNVAQVKGGVAFGFSPVFWNTAWTDGQAPHTLGLRVDPKHPLFESFPTSHHTDWQWWDLIGYPSAQAGAMVINDLPAELEPLVQPIDTWFRARRLASVFEARVGEGKIVVSAMDLATDLDKRPAARQMRESLVRYMSSDAFDPEVEVTLEQIASLLREPSTIELLGATITDASDHQANYGPQNALDGKPGTLWHTRWSGNQPERPHTITIDMARPGKVAGLTYTPRQDKNINGQVDRYAVSVTTDGTTWQRVAEGRFKPHVPDQAVRFESVGDVRKVRLEALSSHQGGPYTAVAELDLIAR